MAAPIVQIIQKAVGRLGNRAGSASEGDIGKALNPLPEELKRGKKGAGGPLLEDPEQRALLEEISAKRKSIETGASAASAVEDIEQAGASTRGTISKSTGGDVGSTIEALLKSQKVESGAISQAQSQSQSQLPFFLSTEERLLGNISQRKLDLQQFEKVQGLAERAQAGKESSANTNALTGILASSSGLGGGTEAGGGLGTEPANTGGLVGQSIESPGVSSGLGGDQSLDNVLASGSTGVEGLGSTGAGSL